MAQNFINFFSRVDIDGICYIVKIVTKYDDLYFFLNIPFLTIMMQNWTKTSLHK